MKNKFSDIHFNSRLLALEMEKRDIKVIHKKGTKILHAEYKGHKEIIDNTDLSVMPANLREILDDKWQTKCLLRYLGFSIPEGMIFKQNEFKKAREYAKKLLPVTIKPINGCHGEGVRPNIETIEEFDTEFKKLVKELRYKSDFLVEKNIFEDEYRLVTTRDGFFAAVYRIRPKVTGDGKKSIKELIRNENYRRMHPRNSCLCEIWTGDKEVERYLRKQGLNLDYIPRKGQNIVLRANVNVCTGAECMDITDLVHPFYKYLTLKVLSKVPNLPYCSVDIFTEDITKYKEGDKYYIGEINPDPGISLHTHPNIGTPRNLPAALIDLIFPETKKEIVGKLPRNTIINKKLDTFSKLKNYFSQKSPKNWFIKPMAVEIEITTKCNLRCKGCYMLEEVKKGKENLSAKEILNLLKQVEKIGIYAFALTGGEALLRLDDVCEIIKKANIDLQKIQTNGSHFTSEEKTLNILNKLKKAGIDKKNKYLKPTINCSIGMQTEAGVPLKNAAILIKCISEVFGDKVNMAINIGVYKEEDGDVILKKLEEEYRALTGENFPYNRVRINQYSGIVYTKNLAKEKLIDCKKITLGDRIQQIDFNRDCFNFHKIKNLDTPNPKILLRADGTVFACSCNGHAHPAGNMRRKPIKEIMEEMNRDKVLRILATKGINELAYEVSKKHPGILKTKIPISYSNCHTCKILREIYFNKSFNN